MNESTSQYQTFTQTKVKKRKASKITKRRNAGLSAGDKKRRRLESNDRERARMHTLNKACQSLKGVIPPKYFESLSHLRRPDSKLATILAATEAITDLLSSKKDAVEKHLPSLLCESREEEIKPGPSDRCLHSANALEAAQIKRNVQKATATMTPKLVPYEQVLISWEK